MLQKSLYYLNERIYRYENKVKKTKETLKEFTVEKHDELTEILSEWVDAFNDQVFKAKQTIKDNEVAKDIKIEELNNDNSFVILNLKEKIKKTCI